MFLNIELKISFSGNMVFFLPPINRIEFLDLGVMTWVGNLCILQMRHLRPRETKSFTWGHRCFCDRTGLRLPISCFMVGCSSKRMMTNLNSSQLFLFLHKLNTNGHALKKSVDWWLFYLDAFTLGFVLKLIGTDCFLVSQEAKADFILLLFKLHRRDSLRRWAAHLSASHRSPT